MKRRGHFFYRRFLAGKDDHDYVRRREFALNALLCGISIASVLALLTTTVLQHFDSITYRVNTTFHLSIATIIIIGLWRLARSWHYKLAAYLFLGFIGAIVLYSTLTWSFELPSVIVLCAFLIMIAGMIVGTQGLLTITVGLVASYLIIGYAQVSGLLHPDTRWLKEPLAISNCLDYAIMLSIIGLMSWLVNKETDHFLKAAQQFQAELIQERDSLEDKITARTNQLEQTQLARTLELQRFADFGRINAHLLHEVANPLTAAAIHLELLGKQPSAAIVQVRRNIHQLERYINAARKQLKSESRKKDFTVAREIKQSLAVIQPIAQRAHVRLEVGAIPTTLKLFGDSVKFNQIFANIVVNAIDAYADVSLEDEQARRITITCQQHARYLVITVKDRGKGIAPHEMAKLFEPFFTTKGESVRGLGIGLSLVKQTVEQDFAGAINVSSNKQNGTIFTIKLKMPAAKRQLKPIVASTPLEPTEATVAFAT